VRRCSQGTEIVQPWTSGLQESGLDPKLGKKLLDDAIQKGFGDLLKKKNKKK